MQNDDEIKEGKIFALMGYLSILCLIPLILKKDNKFVLYHAKQGLVIFIIELILMLIGILPFIGWLISVLGTFLCMLISLYGIIECLIGNYVKIPLVSYIASKIDL
ncbi:MAG: hypothetical protein AB1755_00665 [Candidatus Omnitrophota bacterium]